jgi:hypothetical protein
MRTQMMNSIRQGWIAVVLVLLGTTSALAQDPIGDAVVRDREAAMARDAEPPLRCGAQKAALAVAGGLALAVGLMATPDADSRSGSPVLLAAGLLPLEAVEASATVSAIAGYNVWGTAGLVGTTYTYDILGLYASGSSRGLVALAQALRAQAAAAGATEIRIVGRAILAKNQTFFSQRVAARFGLTVECVDADTVILRGKL